MENDFLTKISSNKIKDFIQYISVLTHFAAMWTKKRLNWIVKYLKQILAWLMQQQISP